MKRIIFVLLFVVIGVLVYFSRSSKPPAKVEALDSASSSGSSESKVFTRASVRGAPQEIASANADIAQLKAWLKERNHDAIQGQLEKMALDLKEHPERLHEILEGLRTEIDPDLLPLLSRVILASGAITNQLVIDTALQLAKNDTVEPRRHAGLFLLGEVPTVTAEMSDSVASVSREAKEKLVQTSALATMADWMEDHPEMKASLGGEILKTVQSSETIEVRANGLLFLANHLQELPENFTTEMITFLDDASHYNRATAARALSKLADKRAVLLPLIEQALEREANLDARRIMLGAIVAANNNASRDTLQRYANDPGLSQDVRDYLGILESGLTDPAKIAQLKEEIEVARNPVVIEKH